MIANFCFVCDKELDGAFGGLMSEDDPTCAGAVLFKSSGNYGSSIFDPRGPVQMVINICDDCIKLKRDRVLIATTERPLPVVSYEPWNPERYYE